VAWSADFAELRGSSCGAVKEVGVGSLENRETAARGRATMPGCVRLICTRVQGSKSRRASWIGVDRRSSFSSSLDRLFVLSSRRARFKASCKMRYRLPLELELVILELAAPPLAIDSLHDRVDFFIKISLVYRSFTAWAQDKLHDQFLYTYQPRPDEHARLKTRFEAGFAGRDRPVRRLYLDLSRLPDDVHGRIEPGTDSVSVTEEWRVSGPISLAEGPGGPEQAGTSAQEQACEAVAHFVLEHIFDTGHRELCTMITDYSQALDTLWLRLPYEDLDIKNLPRVSLIEPGPQRLSATQG
jgi:hypothetical protein